MFKNIIHLKMHEIKKSRLWHMVCLIFIFFLYASPVSAHRATIFAWIDGDTVHTQSKFSGGRKAVGAQVEVYDANGHKLLSGKTDNNGDFSFKLPKKTALKIVLQAGSGHHAEWKISAEEIEEASGKKAFYEEKNPKVAVNSSQTAETDPIEESPKKIVTLEYNELKKMIDESLDKKLAPIIKILADTYNRGPDIRDIIGGIGYIIGLVGIALYVANRRNKN
ncbi:MAG: hypothetical protein JRJ27_10775 [Deltaproteobacteria bacterium]|nr:hypothetical protein [Deltaproteobacteria bacterium]MBW2364566.1 hypothetical protein [Deltaproteobacteria bacterium]